MKKKSRLAKQTPGINPILKIANRVGTQYRKAYNRLNWRDKCRALRDIKTDGKTTPEATLKLVQAQRDAGVMDEDQALILIMHTVDKLAEKTIEDDPALTDLSGKMDVICKREGLDTDNGEYFDLKDPATPKDWLALNARYAQRINENQAAIQEAYGEDDIAYLFLKDQKTLMSRAAEGYKKMEAKFGKASDPAAKAPTPGDTGPC